MWLYFRLSQARLAGLVPNSLRFDLNFPQGLKTSSVNKPSASYGWKSHLSLFVPVNFTFLSQLHHIFVYLNVFHTDFRTLLILPVQPGPDSANLSPRPTHLLSITPQTNWTVTPLSGPRLHFSSHPSLPKHSFFFTVTFSAAFDHTFTLPSWVRHLYVCPPCLTAFTSQDWITSLLCKYTHTTFLEWL